MSERLRESLSALMDDEADDLELGRILRAMDSGEADLGATWSRYQLVSALLKGSPGSVGLRPLELDLLAAEIEPMDDKSADVIDQGMGSHATGVRPDRGRARRALGSFAVAASITAVAVVGWQWQAGGEMGEEKEVAQMAAGSSIIAPGTASPVSVLPALRTADQRGLMPASEPGRVGFDLARMQQPSPSVPAASAAPTAEAMEAGMRQQVEAYMVRHAEHNALHSRSGVMPFARMAAFDGAQ